MTLTVKLSDLAAERLELFAWEGETASQTVSRLVNERYNSTRPRLTVAEGIDKARSRYRDITGRWPEESP